MWSFDDWSIVNEKNAIQLATVMMHFIAYMIYILLTFSVTLVSYQKMFWFRVTLLVENADHFETECDLGVENPACIFKIAKSDWSQNFMDMVKTSDLSCMCI